MSYTSRKKETRQNITEMQDSIVKILSRRIIRKSDNLTVKHSVPLFFLLKKEVA